MAQNQIISKSVYMEILNIYKKEQNTSRLVYRIIKAKKMLSVSELERVFISISNLQTFNTQFHESVIAVLKANWIKYNDKEKTFTLNTIEKELPKKKTKTKKKA